MESSASVDVARGVESGGGCQACVAAVAGIAASTASLPAIVFHTL
jgi:hypothetical protein